jgi:penicillin-binding protein 1C
MRQSGWQRNIHIRSPILRQWRRFTMPLWIKVLLAVLLLGLSVRSLPYLAPIRVSDLRQNQQAIRFTDRTGLPLGTVLTRNQEHTVAVSLTQVSLNFQQAILAAEDQRFYQHGAIDYQAMLRAVLEAIQARQIVSGASTITMQLARMLDSSPRTLTDKLQEIWTAWRLSAGMSKAEILQAYINRLPMGGNIYGVEAAARIYFGIPAQDLTVAQASLLAAIPNDPNRLHPHHHWQALKRRQAYVLDRMVQDGYLTRAQAEKAGQEAIALHPLQQGIIAAPHLLFWLADRLPAELAEVRTTLDRPLQQFVEAQMQQVLRSMTANNVNHAAALVLDNHAGEVLAYVGSPDYFAAEMGRNDGVQALRQPGSALKPFLYQLALEQRLIRPNTILADVPTRYALPGAKLYSPADYSETFQGPVRVRVALANSLNVPAVRVLEKVGVPRFLTHLRQLGFQHLDRPPDHYGLGLALGSGEVSLWELAHAYLTLARQGNAIDLRYQLHSPIQPSTQNSTQNSKLKIQNSSTWALLTDMLSDPQARAIAFGVDSLLRLPFPAAVKTGTSSDFRDTWTVGFTTDYTVAVWVGNFDGAPMRQVSGVTGAAPLWNRIMLHLHQQQEPKPFAPPAGMVQRPICALSGARPTVACPTIVQEYLFTDDLADYDRQPDPFYQTVTKRAGRAQVRLQLPAEYTEWLAMQPSALIDRSLRISSPRQGDVFLLEASPAIAQQLEFKLTDRPNQFVEWRLNGKLLAKNETDALFWVPQPGNWTLQVTGDGIRDRVRFQVQTTELRPTRRGFSFTQTTNPENRATRN